MNIKDVFKWGALALERPGELVSRLLSRKGA